MPQGGFGSLIALPLQKGPRQQDNSVFLDDNFVPWTDQWAFLASLRRIGRVQVERIVEGAERRGRILGVRLPPQDDGDDEPWTAPPSRHRKEAPIVGALPPTVELVLGDQISVLGLACELQRDWGRPDANRLRTIMREYFVKLKALQA